MADQQTLTHARTTKFRRLSAATMACGVVSLDLLLELLCLRFPLLFYLFAAGCGYAFGGPLSRWSVNFKWFAWLLQWTARRTILVGTLGAVGLTLYTPPWESKCGWRYCGRVLGPSLFQSPFPAPDLGCRTLNRCANEFQYSKAKYAQLCDFMEERGCAPP